ncbi:hypothetical protein TTHERM_00138220 (macronuclear) [Tetrahymena thermophila SB210]|uniref:Uncharacterized protein n=1 Tax=Tetrahymena thermophila (strain SB210) TaxID=312017 RepID=I7MKM4_TETTS|nr:hypothetical protein TTHERM_00138220 [Tetrahymena thermophila SB210]EAR99559.2 hypothetical protein TTHERM_00138220 [Tetrahymena thermophila SB210]|eukprot:XP_001019804.2 hypothetical protein TTHERM_00138220 [Tetrahymena thermophila SB210]
MIKQPPSIIRTELTSPNQANKIPCGKIFMKSLLQNNTQSSPIQKIKQSQYQNASYSIKNHLKSEEDEELSKSYLNDTRQNLSQSGWNSIQSNVNAYGKQQHLFQQNQFNQNQDYLSKNGKSDFSFSKINALLHEQNAENSYLFRYNSKRNSNINQISSKQNSRAHSEDITQNNFNTNNKDDSFRTKKQSLHLPKQDHSPQKSNMLTENSTYFNGTKSPQKNWKDIEDEIKILKKVLKQNIADISTTNISLNKSQIESNQLQSKHQSQHSPLKESNFLSTKQTLNTQNENVRPLTSLSSQSTMIQQLMQENSNLKREIEKLKINQKVELEEVMNREREEIKIVISQYKQFIDKLLNDKKSLNVNIHQLNVQLQQIQEESRKLKSKNQELQTELDQVKQEYLSLLEEWNDKEERENDLSHHNQNNFSQAQQQQQELQNFYPLNVERIDEENSQEANSQNTNQTRKISSAGTQSQDRAIDSYFGNYQFDNHNEEIRRSSGLNISNEYQCGENNQLNLRPQSQNQNKVQNIEQNQEINPAQHQQSKSRQNQNNYQGQYNYSELNNNSQRNYKSDADFNQPQQQSFNDIEFNQREHSINQEKEYERKTSASFKDGLLAHLNEVINNISQEKMKIRDALKSNLASSTSNPQIQNQNQTVNNQQTRNQQSFINQESSKISQNQLQISSEKLRNNSSRSYNDYQDLNINQNEINSQSDVKQQKKPDDDLQQQYESIIQKIKEQQMQKQQNHNNIQIQMYNNINYDQNTLQNREDNEQHIKNEQLQHLPLSQIQQNNIEQNYKNSSEQFSFREYS